MIVKTKSQLLLAFAFILGISPGLCVGDSASDLSLFMDDYAEQINDAIASSDKAVGVSISPNNQLDAIDSARLTAMSRLASKQGTTEVSSRATQNITVSQQANSGEQYHRNDHLVIESKTRGTLRTNTLLVSYDADARKAIVILQVKTD